MKPFTSFKVLTLASLLVYTGSVFAGDVIAQDQGKVNTANTKTLNQKCATKFNLILRKEGLSQISTKTDADGNLSADDPALAAAAKDNRVSAAYNDFGNCIAGTPAATTNIADAQCSKIEDQIDDAAKELSKDCAHPPKVSSDVADDSGAVATADTAKDNRGQWSTCLQDATSCQTATMGDNDSADSCADSTLEDLTKNGATPEKLKSYCQDKYPPQCGGFDKADLRTTAKDMDKDLNDDVKELTKDIADKKKDIQDNQDKLQAADKKNQGFAKQFAAQNKALQDQYEAAVKASNSKLDAGLENNYKLIGNDQAAIKVAAAAVTAADATKFDAQNKFVNACKTQAKAAADKQYPSGSVNYGGQNALVTRNARWSDFYQQQLQNLYADGTTCDGGNYANTQLALLNAQKSQADSQAQLLQDQNNLKIAMQQVTANKNDAQYKQLTDQQTKVQQLATQQKQDYQDNVTETSKLRTKATDLQTELQKLQTKLDNVPKKKQCIQTIRSCANVAGVPSGGSKDVPDIQEAPTLNKRLIGLCQRAAKICKNEKGAPMDKDDSLADFKAKIPDLADASGLQSYFPYDINKADCAQAIASQLEVKGPANKKKSKGKKTDTSDTAKKK